MTNQEYLDLITSEHTLQPNFVATVQGCVDPVVLSQNLIDSFSQSFDLSTPPVGDQLDIIGKWVGVSRNIAIPISGVYFTWDGTNANGWDYGSWQPSDAPTQISTLPDDAYLTLVKAKIAANNWDGTTEGAYTIWNSLFTGFTILIQDYQNMSYALVIAGGAIDSLTMALIVGGYIPLRPEGVLVAAYFIAVDSGPVFAWDTTSTLLGGWDSGSWAIEK